MFQIKVRMKILQICNKPPLPKIDGGCIAIHNISEGLLKTGEELHILTASTEKHPLLPEVYSEYFKNKTLLDGAFIDTRINIIDAFSALVTSDSYNVSRFFSPDLDKKIAERLLKFNYDIVQLESLFMTPYIHTIRRNSRAKIVLRSHNLEHLIWERLAEASNNQAKKLYLKHLSARLKTYELKTINEVDGIAAISFEDTRRYQDLECKVPLTTIPFGIELKNYTPAPASKSYTRLFHIGAMNWAPNSEAITWFLDEIWPEMTTLPVELHLAGRSMPESYMRLEDERIKIHGEVAQATDFMNAYDVMVVPLLSGSGMRVKIIEGMALGKVVITTSIGAEGIEYTNGKNILIADTPEEFRDHVKRLVENPDSGSEIARNARLLVEEKYNNEVIIQNLVRFYESLIHSQQNG